MVQLAAYSKQENLAGEARAIKKTLLSRNEREKARGLNIVAKTRGRQ